MTTKTFTVADIQKRLMSAAPVGWEYFISDDGQITLAMDENHSVGWDMEGACPSCFAYLEFAADAPAMIRYLLAENARLAMEMRG